MRSKNPKNLSLSLHNSDIISEVENQQQQTFNKNKKFKQLLILGGFLLIMITIINIYYFYISNLQQQENYNYNNEINDIYSFNLILPNPPKPELKDLIIIPGHSIYLGGRVSNGNIKDDLEDLDNWILEDYQRNIDHVKTFMKHIERGLELLGKNNESLLIFSGGQTRFTAGPKTESQSYWEYAKDSYENLIFSICRFYEFTGNYPNKITIIGFKFKSTRFINLHRLAIKFPLERFNYIGIDPENNLLDSEADLYGCHDKLQKKKLLRNPFRRR
ncbi:20500_t:CDS:2 [Entrophospora sp. SA101]|nr:5984_t:CDS:2 [Entrophospora sp. SA101]CAJ0764718.1 20500_t:CDS:2 [Entrophospora sp. SA101]CAJ0840387.1 9292_t:CDS:2 [Entrophospora sp. SA101]